MLTRQTFKFRREGFSAIELLVALGITIPLLVGAACLVVAAVRASHSEKVTASFILPAGGGVQTKIVSRRPGPEVELDAVMFHAVLCQSLRHANECFVFGAAPQGVAPTTPAGAAFLQIGPLQLSSWPDLTTGALKEKSAREFLTDFPALGGTAPYTGSDFTLVVVGPTSVGIGVSAVAQVLSVPATVAAPATAANDQLVLVWARLWTAEGSWEYAWLAPQALTSTVTWASQAAQYWTWVDEPRGVFEAGPVICRFPDPVTSADVAAGVSRFTYTL